MCCYMTNEARMNLEKAIKRLLDYNTSMDVESRLEIVEHLEHVSDVLNDFVTENCQRAGEEDWPASAEEQINPIVKKAMIILDI